MPEAAILVETKARNTAENILLTRRVPADEGVKVATAELISRPYQQRYALGIAAKLWPEVEFIGTAEPTAMPDYMSGIGDPARVVTMLVRDVQRIAVTADQGLAVRQEIPEAVLDPYWRLVDAGFVGRLITGEALSRERRVGH